jgi:hypothetical protein
MTSKARTMRLAREVRMLLHLKDELPASDGLDGWGCGRSGCSSPPGRGHDRARLDPPVDAATLLHGEPVLFWKASYVCRTTGVQLRGPERSEGHVSCNGRVRPPVVGLYFSAKESQGGFGSRDRPRDSLADSNRAYPGFFRQTPFDSAPRTSDSTLAPVGRTLLIQHSASPLSFNMS